METETENWLKQEAENFSKDFDGERSPALKFEEGKPTSVSIDVSKQFDTWKNPEDGTIKKIIPCMVDGVSYVWWLNVKNPVYSEIVLKATAVYPEPLVVSILQTGTKKQTRYSILK